MTRYLIRLLGMVSLAFALCITNTQPLQSAGPASISESDLLKCAATATVKNALGGRLAGIPNVPDYPTRYGNKVILAIIDSDPSLRNLENRAETLHKLLDGVSAGELRSPAIDKAKYLVSHTEAQVFTLYSQSTPLFVTAIRYCVSKGVDLGDFNLAETTTLIHQTGKAIDDVGAGQYRGVARDYCSPNRSVQAAGASQQRNSYVAGIPNDFCEREAFYRGTAPIVKQSSSYTCTANNNQGVLGDKRIVHAIPGGDELEQAIEIARRIGGIFGSNSSLRPNGPFSKSRGSEKSNETANDKDFSIKQASPYVGYVNEQPAAKTQGQSQGGNGSDWISLYRVYGFKSPKFGEKDSTEGTHFALSNPVLLNDIKLIRQRYTLLPSWGNDLSRLWIISVEKKYVTMRGDGVVQPAFDNVTKEYFVGGGREVLVKNARGLLIQGKIREISDYSSGICDKSAWVFQ